MNIQSRIIASAALGAAAVVTSTVLLILQIVLALPRSKHSSPTRVAAIIAAVLESAALVLLSWLLFTSIRGASAKRVTGVWFGSGIGLCVLAAALSVATVICLSSGKNLEGDTFGFLAGMAILLVLSFATQLLFLVTRFIAERAGYDDRSSTPGMQEIGRQPANRVKTVPYSRTTPPPEPTSRNVSMDSKSPPSSSGGFSATDTIASTVRSISSRTRLLSSNRSLRSQRSQRSTRRPASLESLGHRDRSTANDDSFDSWDTSCVDPQNRQTVLESSSPVAGGRFLETIPASPTTSRSPSPGTPLDLEPPRRQQRRSRSFSPASARTQLPKPPQRAFTQHTSASESHIHPLFRSDSPTPPPLASPGTVVIAAPQAGKIISDRQSIRSLSRLRSGSLPTVSSPLSGNGSFESFPPANGKSLSMASDESGRSEDGMEEREMPERKITPPIPEYILNAGSRSSLVGFQARKTPSREGPSGPGLEALPPTATW